MTKWKLVKNLFLLFPMTFIEFVLSFKREIGKYRDRKIINLDKEKKVSIVLRKDIVDMATELNANNFPPHPSDMQTYGRKYYESVGVNIKENDNE